MYVIELIKRIEIRIPFVMRHRVYGAVLRYARRYNLHCTNLGLTSRSVRASGKVRWRRTEM